MIDLNVKGMQFPFVGTDQPPPDVIEYRGVRYVPDRRGIDRGATEHSLRTSRLVMAVKSSISLTDEQYAFARELVEAGRYASVSAVLQQGVDLLRQRLDAQELEHVAMRELLSRRRQGEYVSAQAMDTRLARMIAQKTPRPWPSALSSRPRPNTTSS